MAKKELSKKVHEVIIFDDVYELEDGDIIDLEDEEGNTEEYTFVGKITDIKAIRNLSETEFFINDLSNEAIFVVKDNSDLMEEVNAESSRKNSSKLNYSNRQSDLDGTNKSKRTNADDYLLFPQNDDDDVVVSTLKEVLNQRQITLNEASEGIENGYNLVYGLKNRNSIKTNSLEKWLEYLNLKIQFVKND